MLEMILDRKIVFILLGGMAVIGVLSKMVVNVILKRLVHAAGNMNKSNHSLMRLIRAKFEHACMVSDRVGNVRVFVDKYLYEYKVLGMRLHTWRRLEKAAAGMCFLIGAAGAALEYMVNGMQEMVIRTGATGAVLAILIYLFHLTTDEGYRLEAAQTYMVDYLENVCQHKYEKTVQKELKVMAPESPVADFGMVSEASMQEEPNQKPLVQEPRVQEPRIREPLIQEEPIQEMPIQEEPIQEMPIKEEPIQGVPLPQIKIPEIKIPEIKMTGIKKSEVKKAEPVKAESEKPEAKPEAKREVLIRQILEEFMA